MGVGPLLDTVLEEEQFPLLSFLSCEHSSAIVEFLLTSSVLFLPPLIPVGDDENRSLPRPPRAWLSGPLPVTVSSPLSASLFLGNILNFLIKSQGW